MRTASKAFSLVEVMIVISVLGVLAFLAVATMSRVVDSARDQKLRSDADTLNRAVMAFIASGGEVSGISDPVAVLQTLKQQAASGARTAGFAGAVIDPRVQFVLQTAEEAQTSAPRIVWNPAEARFEVVAGAGAPGIAAFTLDGVPPQADEVSDRNSPVLYAKESSWIWDYHDVPAGMAPGPSEIPVSETPDSTPPPAPPIPAISFSALAPPVLSIPSGSFPFADFNLSLSISDPNPAGAGILYVSIDYGNWKPYTGAISVAPGSVINAQVLPASDDYTSSEPVEGNYRVMRLPLATPSIQLSATEFNDNLEVIGVRIVDANPPGSAVLAYALTEPGVAPPARSTWAVYPGEFAVNATDFPAGFDVHAYARAANPVAHLDSNTVKRSAGANFTFSDAGSGRVLYVIDASGSMGTAVGTTTRFRLIQDALIGAISRLRSSAEFSVVTFSSDILWTPGSLDFLPANKPNKTSMVESINQFTLGGGTNYEAALQTPTTFSKLPTRVYFLTDGEPSGGGAYDDEVAALALAGVKVYTVGVDLSDAGTTRLKEIAATTGGTATSVSTK